MKLLAIVVLSIVKINLVAQSVVPQQVRATNFIDGAASGIRTGEMNFGIPLAPATQLGHYYLSDQWNIAAILIYQDQKLISGYPVKYNLQDQQVEVKIRDAIIGVSIEKIKSISWQDSLSHLKKTFVNCKEYVLSGVPCSGLLQVLVDGKWVLFKKTSVFIKRSNYVPALDIGKNIDEIQQKESFYFLDGNLLIPIKKKSTLLKDFKNRNITLESFKELNDLNTRNENDLIQLFKHLNESK